MNNSVKLLLFVIGIAGIGATGYLLTRLSNAQLKSDILAKVPLNDQKRFLQVLERMSRQELLDVYMAMQVNESTPPGEIAKFDPRFLARIRVLNAKYNLFT